MLCILKLLVAATFYGGCFAVRLGEGDVKKQSRGDLNKDVASMELRELIESEDFSRGVQARADEIQCAMIGPEEALNQALLEARRAYADKLDHRTGQTAIRASSVRYSKRSTNATEGADAASLLQDGGQASHASSVAQEEEEASELEEEDTQEAEDREDESQAEKEKWGAWDDSDGRRRWGDFTICRRRHEITHDGRRRHEERSGLAQTQDPAHMPMAPGDHGVADKANHDIAASAGSSANNAHQGALMVTQLAAPVAPVAAPGAETPI